MATVTVTTTSYIQVSDDASAPDAVAEAEAVATSALSSADSIFLVTADCDRVLLER